MIACLSMENYYTFKVYETKSEKIIKTSEPFYVGNNKKKQLIVI